MQDCVRGSTLPDGDNIIMRAQDQLIMVATLFFKDRGSAPRARLSRIVYMTMDSLAPWSWARSWLTNNKKEAAPKYAFNRDSTPGREAWREDPAQQ